MTHGQLIRRCLAIGAAGLLLGVALTAFGGGSGGLSRGPTVTAPQAPPPAAAAGTTPAVAVPIQLTTPPPTAAPVATQPVVPTRPDKKSDDSD